MTRQVDRAELARIERLRREKEDAQHMTALAESDARLDMFMELCLKCARPRTRPLAAIALARDCVDVAYDPSHGSTREVSFALTFLLAALASLPPGCHSRVQACLPPTRALLSPKAQRMWQARRRACGERESLRAKNPRAAAHRKVQRAATHHGSGASGASSGAWGGRGVGRVAAWGGRGASGADEQLRVWCIAVLTRYSLYTLTGP